VRHIMVPRYSEFATKGSTMTRAAAATGQSARRSSGGRSYERWTKRDLYERARELGIRHRSRMTKGELIDALRQGRSLVEKQRAAGTAADLGSWATDGPGHE
jgi:hypothetical protein